MITCKTSCVLRAFNDVKQWLSMVSQRDIITERYAPISIVILLIAVALRFYHLGGTSLWLDEAVYANNSMTDFRSFIENTRNRNSSPVLLPFLYYIFGESIRDPFLIRIPPAIFSIMSVAVMLALPRTGVSFSVAALAAFILTIAPAQIEYSQEVREYSLSVFFSCMIIFTYALATNKPSKRALYYFSIVLAAAPFGSYGTIFMGLAAVVAFLFVEFLGREYRRGFLLIPVISLLIGILLTYQLTAMYQMDVAKAWYLVRNFPPDQTISALNWLVESGLAYFRQAIGGFGLLSLALVFLYMIFFGRRTGWRTTPNFCLALLILVSGSIVAAFIGAYPFGGIRQHLFATPLIALCVAQSVVSLGGFFRQKGITMAIVVFAACLSLNSVLMVPPVYAEKEDIVSAVSEGLVGIPESNVYVYYAARHAVKFHYPDHQFFVGKARRGDIEGIGNEIASFTNECSVHILFAHVVKDEDHEILQYLKDVGLTLVGHQKYPGAAVAKLSRCGD